MPITFTINHQYGYFVSKYTCLLSDHELVSAYIDFFTGNNWLPGMNELVDISQADCSMITPNGLNQLAFITQEHYKKHQCINIKCAIYSCSDVPFMLARMYQQMSSEERECMYFTSILMAAKVWLIKCKRL